MRFQKMEIQYLIHNNRNGLDVTTSEEKYGFPNSKEVEYGSLTPETQGKGD